MDGFSLVVSVRIRPPGVLSSASATCFRTRAGYKSNSQISKFIIQNQNISDKIDIASRNIPWWEHDHWEASYPSRHHSQEYRWYRPLLEWDASSHWIQPRFQHILSTQLLPQSNRENICVTANHFIGVCQTISIQAVGCMKSTKLTVLLPPKVSAAHLDTLGKQSRKHVW